jgi:hypothetical protein
VGGNGEEEGPAAEEVLQETEGRGMHTHGVNTAPEHYWNLAGKPCHSHANLMQGIQETLFTLSSALETASHTIQQAISGPYADTWKDAWKAEIEQLQNIGTWELIPRPKDKPVIPCHEVLHEKHGLEGEIMRRKVRLATGGHQQVEGINYTETFASGAKIPTIRIILALAAIWDWEIDQVNIVILIYFLLLSSNIYTIVAPSEIYYSGKETYRSISQWYIEGGLYGGPIWSVD